MNFKTILAVMLVLVVASVGIVSADGGVGGDIVNVDATFSDITIESATDKFVVTDLRACELQISAIVTDNNGIGDITDVDFDVETAEGTFVVRSVDVTITPIDEVSVLAEGTITVPKETIEGDYRISVGATDLTLVEVYGYAPFNLYNHQEYYVQDFVITGAVPGQSNPYTLVIVNDHGAPDATLTSITINSLTKSGDDVSSKLTFDYTAGTGFDESGEIRVPANFDATGLLAGNLLGQLTISIDIP